MFIFLFFCTAFYYTPMDIDIARVFGHAVSTCPSLFLETSPRSHPQHRCPVKKGSHSLWLNFRLPVGENYRSSSPGNLVRHENFLLHFVRRSFSAVSKMRNKTISSLFFLPLCSGGWHDSSLLSDRVPCHQSSAPPPGHQSHQSLACCPPPAPLKTAWKSSYILMLVLVTSLTLEPRRHSPYFSGPSACQKRDFCISSYGCVSGPTTTTILVLQNTLRFLLSGDCW